MNEISQTLQSVKRENSHCPDPPPITFRSKYAGSHQYRQQQKEEIISGWKRTSTTPKACGPDWKVSERSKSMTAFWHGSGPIKPSTGCASRSGTGCRRVLIWK